MNRDLQYGNFSLPYGDVWNLQLGLQELGYGVFTPTGFFGDKTRAAVSRFQVDNNISPALGYFGSKTIIAFNTALDSSRNNRLQIFSTVLALVGTDVTPEDIVPDEYDCSDTVCTILAKAGFPVGNFPLTTDLFKYFTHSKEWSRVYEPYTGDVIISPTGWGNGQLSNGHVGFVGENSKIYSNSSATGLLTQNYTLTSWKARYVDIGGFPMLYMRRK